MQKCKKTILLLKRALGIPYVNRIDFFCFLTFRKKIGFCIWMKITMSAIVERQRARFYEQKKQKNCEALRPRWPDLHTHTHIHKWCGKLKLWLYSLISTTITAAWSSIYLFCYLCYYFSENTYTQIIYFQQAMGTQ